MQVISSFLELLAPGQSNELWQHLQQSNLDGRLARISQSECAVRDSLLTAMEEAPKTTCKQILSIIASSYTKDEFQGMVPGLSRYAIDEARRHRRVVGAGQPVPTVTQHRERLDMKKAEHFIEFLSQPAFIQDVAYGTRKLRLDSGESILIPNVIRTVIMSTIIKLYNQFCSEVKYMPLSDASLYRVGIACAASQRK